MEQLLNNEGIEVKNNTIVNFKIIFGILIVKFY